MSQLPILSIPPCSSLSCLFLYSSTCTYIHTHLFSLHAINFSACLLMNHQPQIPPHIVVLADSSLALAAEWDQLVADYLFPMLRSLAAGPPTKDAIKVTYPLSLLTRYYYYYYRFASL